MKNNLLLLISLQVMPIFLMDKWCSQQDIILEQMDNQAKIIRQGIHIAKLINTLLEKGILIGSYSNKPIKKQISFYQSLGLNSKKIYFTKRNIGQPYYIPSNRALIQNNNEIVYSYLQNVFTNVKESERVAYITTLKVKQQNTIIIENSKAQFKLLNHQKYKKTYLITQKNILNILNQINDNMQLYAKPNNEQLSQIQQQVGQRIETIDLQLNKWQILQERPIFNIIPYQKSLNNKSISSFILNKNNKFFLAKTEYSHQHQLQNEVREFASQIFQYFQSFVLPYTTGKAYIKNGVISEIDKKITSYSICPYIRGLESVQLNKQIFLKNDYNEKQLIGLGKILFFAFWLNQDFRIKSLFQQISMKNIYAEKQILVYRFQFYSLFNQSQHQVNLEELLIAPNKGISIKVSECGETIQMQFNEMIKTLRNMDQNILKGIINHHKWRFIDDYIKQRFLKSRIDLLKIYSKQSLQNSLILSKNSLDYIFHIKKIEFPEIVQVFKCLRNKSNFNLVGQIINIYNLIAHIKNKGYFIEYFSLITEKFEDYQILKKKAAAFRQNAILIVDYCENYTAQQLDTNISNFPIIFIYRIANQNLKGNKLPIIKVIPSKQYTQYQQVTATIYQCLKQCTQNLFSKLQSFFRIWIQIKSFQLKISQNELLKYIDDLLQYKNCNKENIINYYIYSSVKKYAAFIDLKQYNFFGFIQQFLWFKFLLNKIQLGQDFIYTVEIQKSFLSFQQNYEKMKEFKQLLYLQLDNTRISNLRNNIIKLLSHFGIKFNLKQIFLTQSEIIQEVFLTQQQIIVIAIQHIYIYSKKDLNRTTLTINSTILFGEVYQNQLFVISQNRIKRLTGQLVWQNISGELNDPKFKMINSKQFFTYNQKEINLQNKTIKFETEIVKLQFAANIIFIQTGSILFYLEINNQTYQKQLFKNIISFKLFKQKNILLVTFKDFTLKTYNFKTFELLNVIQQYNLIHCFSFGSSLDMILTNLQEDVIYIWKISQNKIVKKIYNIGLIPKRIQWIEDNKILLISSTGLSKLIYVDN